MNAFTIAAKPPTQLRPRRIPLSVRNAVLEVLEGLSAQVLTDAEFANDIAAAVLDAWEAVGIPVLTVDRHPGGGWYWQCDVDGAYCACGSWSNWYGWPTEVDARDEGRIHVVEKHPKGTP